MTRTHCILAALAVGTLAATAWAETPTDPLLYSSPDAGVTPAEALPFHGPFTRETVTVKAEKLPPHDWLEVSLDLLVMRTWDGSRPVTADDSFPEAAGPDFFRIGIHGGPTLLYTSFSNLPSEGNFQSEGKFQQYPSMVPGDTFEPCTGAAAKNKYGFGYPAPGLDKLYPMDALYTLKFIVPHKADRAEIDLTGIHLQDIDDEQWGVSHMKVRAVEPAEVKKPTGTEIEAAFEASLDTTTKDLPARFQTLIFGMDDTTDFLARRIKPNPIDGAELERVIQDLLAGDTHMEQRAAAQASLVRLGILAEPALRDARAKASREQQARIDLALITLNVKPAETEQRETALAARVLEIIGTPKARSLRKRLCMY